MHGDPKIREALETIEETEKWIRRERIRLTLRSFAIAAFVLLCTRIVEADLVSLLFFYALAAVMSGLGVWNTVKVLRERGK